MRRHFLFVLVASFVANGALAQSSVAPASLYAAADVIFTARLVRLSISPSGSVAHFEVSEFIKGTARKQKYLRAQVSIQGDCHAFEENHRYLIYGRRIGDQLWINPCEGSKLISLAEPDLKYIHSVNSKVSEQCNQSRLAKIARSSRIVVTAEVVGTEDTMGSPTFFRPWCGLAFTTEDAYYRVTEVLKGEVSDPNIAVEHVICWDTITVGGYSPALSPNCSRKGTSFYSS